MIDWIDRMALEGHLLGSPRRQPGRLVVSYGVYRASVNVGGRIVWRYRVDRRRQQAGGSWLHFDEVVVGWFASEPGAMEAAEIDLENLAPRPNQR